MQPANAMVRRGTTTDIAVICSIFIGASFFPNPALPLTSGLGLQLSQLIAILLVPFILLKHPPVRHLMVIAITAAVFTITSFATLLFHRNTQFDLYVKMAIVVLLAMVVIIPAGYFAETMPLRAIAMAAALAILANVLMSVYEIYSFGQGVVPFQGLINNPSFSLISEDTETYALYIKRPYGFFPEPSAMGASMGPWLILLAGMLMNGRLQMRRESRTYLTVLVAVVSGCVIMFAARSGYTALWLASFAPVLGFYGIIQARPGLGRMVRYLYGGMLALICALMAWTYIAGTLDSASISDNDSWESRRQSIVIAFTSPWQDPLHLLFGFGPGQAPTYLMSNLTRNLLPYWYQTSDLLVINTVWSVLGTFFMENGLVGGIAMLVLFGFIIRAVFRSSARILGYSVFLAWFFGALIATSYFPLSPMWLIVGLLLVWDRVFPVATAESTTA